MSLLSAVSARIAAVAQKRWYSRHQPRYDLDLSLVEAVERFKSRDAVHAYMHHYFRHRCPETIREHRAYFARDRRGFGEDAFHAMWWILLRDYRPRHCVEIGVYRGQVITLWSLAAKLLGFPCEVHGISPFSAAGDAVSAYPADVDYLVDTLSSFQAWELPAPTLIKAYSTDPAAIAHVAERQWDLIYIDGSHDYEVALADYELCREHLKPAGLLVLDDASLGTDYHPPSFSFAGHPGPSRVAAQFAQRELKPLGAVGHNNVFQRCDTAP